MRMKRRSGICIMVAALLLCPLLSGAEEAGTDWGYAQSAIYRQDVYGFPPAGCVHLADPAAQTDQETLGVLLVCLYEHIRHADLPDTLSMPEELVSWQEREGADTDICRRYIYKAVNAGFVLFDNDGAADMSDIVTVGGLTETLSSFLSAMTGQDVLESEVYGLLEASANRHWGAEYGEDDSIFQTEISDSPYGEMENRRTFAIVDDLIDAYGWEL